MSKKIVYRKPAGEIDENSPFKDLKDGDDATPIIKQSTFGHLDEYFNIMMEAGQVKGEEKEVYELAVRAFINDISFNGLPAIRRERYNRELAVSTIPFGLQENLKELMKTKREYHP
jgi:hypothetical protein